MNLSNRVTDACAALTTAAIFFLPFSKSAAEVAGITALCLWTLFGPAGRFRRVPREVFLLYAVFLVATVVSLINVPAPYLADSLRGVLKWIKYLGFFFMSADLFGEPARFRRLVSVFMASLFLVVLNGLYQMWTGADLIKHYTVDIPGRFIRMTSSFSAPNGLAAFLLMGVPLTFVVWYRQKSWSLNSVGLVALLTLFSTALAMTLTRAAILALAVAATINVIRRVPKATWVLAAGFTAFLTSSRFIFDIYVKSLQLSDITVSERLRVWKTTWAMISHHPFIGNGVNTYFKLFPSFMPPEETFRGYAHNCYLQMWSEIGLIGAVAFTAALVWMFTKKLAAPQRDPLDGALWVGLTALALQSAVDTNFYSLQTATLFWVFWGAFCGSANVANAAYSETGNSWSRSRSFAVSR